MSESCSECGYLAVRHRQTRQLLEAEGDLRERGYLLTEDPLTRQTVYERCPVCFVYAVNFLSELGHTPTEERVKGEVQKLRRCDKYTPWHPGSTPKEHQEMLIEKERLAWQKQREEADQEFRSRETERADDRHQQTLRLTAQLHQQAQADEWRRLVATLALGAAIASAGWMLGGWLDGVRPVQPINAEIEWSKDLQPPQSAP